MQKSGCWSNPVGVERRPLAGRRHSVWSRLSICLDHLLSALSFLSDRSCKERLRMSLFAKRGNPITLRLGVRLCPFRSRRMGDVLRMAFTQNRVRSCTSTVARVFVSRRAFSLGHGLALSIRLIQPFMHHSSSCDS